jgi:hypothetical protein
MSTNPLATAASGALFGAALTAAGVVSPATIIAQMKLTDLRMLKVFITATGTSAYATLVAHFSMFTLLTRHVQSRYESTATKWYRPE